MTSAVLLIVVAILVIVALIGIAQVIIVHRTRKKVTSKPSPYITADKGLLIKQYFFFSFRSWYTVYFHEG